MRVMISFFDYEGFNEQSAIRGETHFFRDDMEIPRDIRDGDFIDIPGLDYLNLNEGWSKWDSNWCQWSWKMSESRWYVTLVAEDFYKNHDSYLAAIESMKNAGWAVMELSTPPLTQSR